MMKLAIYVGVAYLVASVMAYCPDNPKCEESECCLFDGPLPKCSKHSMEGDRCVYNFDESDAGRRYASFCPCEKGLDCRAMGEEENKKNCVKMDP